MLRRSHRLTTHLPKALRLILLAGIALTAGCASLNYEAPVESVSLPAVERIPLKVELRLSDEFASTVCKGNPGQLGLGPGLAANSEALARALFTEVVVVRGSAMPLTSGVDAQLTPSVVGMARNRPKLGSSDQTSTVVVEWALKDRNGNLVWLESVEGDGVAAVIHADEQGNALMQDLFQKSARTIASSTEIHQFAARHP
jgi:hypothetical protein